MPRHSKSDRELLEDIYDCINGTLEKRGLVRRVEILEWWKKVMTSALLWLSGTTIVGLVGWFFTTKMVGK